MRKAARAWAVAYGNTALRSAPRSMTLVTCKGHVEPDVNYVDEAVSMKTSDQNSIFVDTYFSTLSPDQSHDASA